MSLFHGEYRFQADRCAVLLQCRATFAVCEQRKSSDACDNESLSKHPASSRLSLAWMLVPPVVRLHPEFRLVVLW